MNYSPFKLFEDYPIFAYLILVLSIALFSLSYFFQR